MEYDHHVGTYLGTRGVLLAVALVSWCLSSTMLPEMTRSGPQVGQMQLESTLVLS